MARGDAQHDLETARSVRPGRQWPNHDHGERYDGNTALFPNGWDDLDPGRFDVPCSGDWSPTRSSWGWFKATCLDCRHIAMGRTGAEFKAAKREHLR